MSFDLLVSNGCVVLDTGRRHVDIGIRDGRVAALLEPGGDTVDAGEVIDAGGRFVIPGVVDPHAHIGFGGPDDWGTESQMAARGGVTTVLNYVMGGASYFDQVAAEREVADRLTWIDYGLHVCPCTEQHLDEIGPCVTDLGVASFKAFMSFRGEEGAYLGIAGTDDGYLHQYLSRVAAHPGAVANIHAENIEIVWRIRGAGPSGLDGLAAWDASRPDYTEAEAVSRAAYFAALTGATLYVVHLSSAAGLREVTHARARAGARGRLLAETCPHYLTHTVDSPVGTLGKVNPPLRSAADSAALWEALADGRIQTIGSDHVPRHRSRKEGDVATASAGISGIGTILTVMLSEGVHKRGLTLEKVVELTSANAARIFGLYPHKGTLEVGSDADLVVLDLDREREVEPTTWGGGAGYTLYEGWTMKGWPALTLLRGRVVSRDGELEGTPGGRFLHRPSTDAAAPGALVPAPAYSSP